MSRGAALLAAAAGAAGVACRPQAHDQGRRPALAVGHDGHQRDDAEGHGPDDDRRAEQEGRPARQEARGGRRRSGVELAAVRREGARSCSRRTRSPSCSAAGRRCRRKSVLPVFEKDNGLLFYPVQYEGEESSKNVIYTGAAPNQQAIPAVDYLMKDVGVKRWVLEGTDYVYPRTTNKILEAYLLAKGVEAGGHLDQLHAVRPLRLADARRRDQEVRLGRQEDGGRLDDQRRRQRAVLQGARQPEDLGGGHSGRRLLGRRRGAVGPRHQAARRPPGGVELLREHQHAGQQGVHRPVARLHQEPEAHDQRSDGSALHRLQPVGEGGGEGRSRPTSRRCSRRCPASRRRT